MSIRPSSSLLWFSCLCMLLLMACQPEPSGEAEAGTVSTTDYEPSTYRWGFLDRNGQLAIADQFDEVRPFSDGLALIRRQGYFGFIDHRGQVVIPTRFRAAWPFRDGLARAQLQQDSVGFINPNGQWVIPPVWEEAFDFSAGLARVRQDQAFGYIDQRGKLVIPPRYERATDFTPDGWAVVRTAEGYGLLNTRGEEVIPCQYDRIKPFSDGLARAAVDGAYGYLDLSENWIIPLRFAQATDFQAGV
ncbi:MAG: WG repeat-containing protein, partial [Lewinella sp.]|nr:WG repeat-containing protein [Lewinella sp.]